MRKLNDKSRFKTQQTTQCETGLLLSKYSIEQTSISEIYESTIQKGQKIDASKLLSVTQNFFEEF